MLSGTSLFPAIFLAPVCFSNLLPRAGRSSSVLCSARNTGAEVPGPKAQGWQAHCLAGGETVLRTHAAPVGKEGQERFVCCSFLVMDVPRRAAAEPWVGILAFAVDLQSHAVLK